MYKINKLQDGKRFVRDFHTRWRSIINLTRSISDTSPTRVKISYAYEVIFFSPYALVDHQNYNSKSKGKGNERLVSSSKL